MQKYFLGTLLVLFSLFVGCSDSKDKTMTMDQLKAKISGKITLPGLGDEIEIETFRLLSQGLCKYIATQSKQVQFVDQAKMESNVTTKYELVPSSTACQSLAPEAKTETINLLTLKSQFMAKVDNLTKEAMFVNIVSTARNPIVQTIKEERYKNLSVATVVVQYTDIRDSRFYKYTAHISMDSYLVGVFDIKVQNLNGETIDQTNLTHVKLNNPVVNYP